MQLLMTEVPFATSHVENKVQMHLSEKSKVEFFGLHAKCI